MSCKNILPTNYSLKQKRIMASDGCDLCGERGTTGHILWEYRIAAETWRESGIKLPSRLPHQGEFIDLVWKLMDQPPDFDWELFATKAWGLWKNRNAFKHEGRCRPARCIVSEVSRYVEEFRQCTMTNPKPPSYGDYEQETTPPFGGDGREGNGGGNHFGKGLGPWESHCGR